MIVRKEGVADLFGHECCWRSPRREVYWAGMLYVPGRPVGRPSVEAFAAAIDRTGLAAAAELLRGHFFLAVRDLAERTVHVFVDRSAIFGGFRSDTAVSTSFLDLVRREGLSGSQLDPEAVVDFVNCGYIPGGRTFFPAIRTVSAEHVLTFSADGKVRPAWRRDTDITRPSGLSDVAAFFQELVESLRGTRVSVDLTGGIDSRLVATLLGYFGLEFETAVSGWDERMADVAVARQVAGALGRELFVTRHRVEDLEGQMDSLFGIADGIADVIGFHRLVQNQRQRLARGAELAISGIGGEMHKDYWWLQDFPFYARRKANLKRLVGLRMVPIGFDGDSFGPDYARASRGLRERILADLGRYVLETNTRTYDNIYFNGKMKTVACRSLTLQGRVVPTFAPLADLDVVRCGFALPRGQRVFDRWHRKLMTRYNPHVARIRSASGGGTVSAQTADLLMDVGKYVADRTKRAVKKAGEKVLRRTILLPRPDHPRLWETARSCPRVGACFERLSAEGVLGPALSPHDVADRHLGKLVTVAMLLEFLDRKPAAAADRGPANG